MKLKKARVREFKSVWDSTEFEVGDVTCFVGKNESGKTALLQALYRLNPVIEEDGIFDQTHDYPRAEVENYNQDVESKRRSLATVVEATFSLEESDTQSLCAALGPNALTAPWVKLTKGYGAAKYTADVPVNEHGIVMYVIEQATLPADVEQEALKLTTLDGLARYLAAHSTERAAAFTDANTKASQLADDAASAAAREQAKLIAESSEAQALKRRVAELQKKTLLEHVWLDFLEPRVPKFLYFDEYYQLKGQDNITKLQERMANKSLQASDRPLLGLLELARLDLAKLTSFTKTQDLKNKLQGASNHLSAQVLKYWSQNRHLRMAFDVREARSEDPENMRSGLNIWAEIDDTKHLASTSLGSRSKGFVWFFSFLAWYSSQKKNKQPLVLLLDEPGTSLHGRAQEDLLKYFDAEVVEGTPHQILYTTHSPFMVDSRRYDRVRIVQDKSIDADVPLPLEDSGTKVFTDVLEAAPDTLFPLQGALGYEIYQTLFVGPNSLVVEGVSDLLYIETVRASLETTSREVLDSRWTVTPVGGADKVPTFVALIGAQKRMKVATLVDFQRNDQQTIENLYRKKLLHKSHVLTFSDFTGKPEADIEDMFEVDEYLGMVNAEYAANLASPISASDLAGHQPRVLVRLAEYLKGHPLKGGAKFTHYRPARRFAANPASFNLSEATLSRFDAAFKALNALLK